jgi:RNA polymerase sigma-70 factor (ECF subfamily)
LWLRFLTAQKLVTLHRHHLGVKMRNADQEVAIHHGSMPGASTAALATFLAGHDTRPSDAAIRAELRSRVQVALDSMSSLEREVLALRHFEQLSRAEIAQELGISEEAAGKRYMRALDRIKHILGQGPGGLEGIRP